MFNPHCDLEWIRSAKVTQNSVINSNSWQLMMIIVFCFLPYRFSLFLTKAMEKMAIEPAMMNDLWNAAKESGDLVKLGGGFYCAKIQGNES